MPTTAVISGVVVGPNGQPLAAGSVSIAAFCTDCGAQNNACQNGMQGRFSLGVDNNTCASGNTTVLVTFSRVVTILTPPPQAKVAGVSATSNTNLGNVKIPD
jgi:hypothetical protein